MHYNSFIYFNFDLFSIIGDVTQSTLTETTNTYAEFFISTRIPTFNAATSFLNHDIPAFCFFSYSFL